ncbi:MAG: sulfide/dihydroorotate dehydrogenase-like FAD/NAD-binding protein [Candidatus Omnitrophota bacterium]
MPFIIAEKYRLNAVVWKAAIETPEIARNAKPGQFVVIRLHQKGERIPLTITGTDPQAGTISVIFQEIGKTTKQFGLFQKGDPITDCIGPLGHPTDFGNVGSVILVAGGVGTAEILPIARYASAEGNRTTAIIGARNKGLVILEDELRSIVDELVVTTDDGSHGRKGLVTGPLAEKIEKERFDLVYCVGPDIMMKAVCDTTKPRGLKTIVSLDANMVDATGMCGTCRVTVGGKMKFSCVDGPEFDGHCVDWDEFLKRQKRFSSEEARSLEAFERERCPKCR